MSLLSKIRFVAIERMARNIKPHQIAFPEQLLFLGIFCWCWFDLGFWNYAGITKGAKKIGLATGCILLAFGTIGLNILKIE